MILNEDYEVIEDKNFDTMPVKLLTGPYSGVILRYTVVMLPESEGAPAKFNFEFVDPANYKEKDLREDTRFIKHVGLVLNAMILEAHRDFAKVLDESREENPK